MFKILLVLELLIHTTSTSNVDECWWWWSKNQLLQNLPGASYTTIINIFS